MPFQNDGRKETDGPFEPYAHRSVPSSTTFKTNILAGRTAFVTGGGSGICYRIVEVLMTHGASVAIMGRKADRLAAAAQALNESTGGKCVATPGDVRSFEDVGKAVESAVTQLDRGRLDMVVCGAAGNFLAPIDGISPKGFKTVQEIDLMGTYHTVKATLPHLKKSHGAYIHISATLHYSAIPWQAAPAAAKAGVDALSQSIAVEFGPAWGIRSNVIAPGMIKDTEGADRLTPKGSEEMATSRIPTQRFGTKDDIANMALFLFSDAGNYCSGAKFVVDGGAAHMQSPWLPYPDSQLDPKGWRNLVVGSRL